MSDYQTALNLLKQERQLSIEEEHQVVVLLKKAVESKCSQAALVLAEIKVNQIAANQGNDSQFNSKLDDEVYNLLSSATELNEGWYEFGSYLLISDSSHYDPNLAREALEKSAKGGDRRAVELLMELYKEGSRGFPMNQERSEFWRRQLREM